MEVYVSLDPSSGDLSGSIYRQLLGAILDGRLRPMERLPPTRELAQRLEVSRNTVAVAYERLMAEGFLIARVGSGTFVCPTVVGLPPGRTAAAVPRGAPDSTELRALPSWSKLPAPTVSAPPMPYDFEVGVPDPQLFPLPTWRRLIARQLRPTVLRAGSYSEPAGHPGLRAAIARHIGVSRSVRAGAADVHVTQGAQQALHLIGRVLIEPGDCVAVEEPGYPPARALFSSLGARVVGVPVDDEGLDVSALPADARLIYVTPSHQYPLGTPMSLVRRMALLSWAREHRSVIIEDDYDSEFRFSDRPLEPLQSLDSDGRVLYVGSFAKTLLPMLRLGFLVAPAALQDALRTARALTDWHGDVVAQGALAELIDDGLLARHIRKATRVYAARHALLTELLRRDFADWLRVVPSAAGLHVCARLAPGCAASLDEVVVEARVHGVNLPTLAERCAQSPPQQGLVLGYGLIDTDRIPEALDRLATAFARRS